MNFLINIHKDSPDVLVISIDKGISRMAMTKDELIEMIKAI